MPVHRDGVLRTPAGKALRTAADTGSAHIVRTEVARRHVVTLAQPLRAEGQRQRIGQPAERDLPGDVDVERLLFRGQDAVVETGRAAAEVIQHRVVGGVLRAVGNAVAAIVAADVPAPVIPGAAQPGDQRGIRRDAMLARQEAVGIDHADQRIVRIRRIAAIAVETARLADAAPVVAERVELHAGADVVLRVEEQVLVSERHRPEVELHAELGQPGATVHAGAVARALVAVFGGDAQPAAFAAQRNAEIRRALPLPAITGGELAAAELHVATLGTLLQDDVDHAGKRVGAVLRGGAIAQHFDVVDRRQRDRVEIDALRALADLAQAQHQRARMPALAVHQHQHLVRRQSTQFERPLEREGVRGRREREVQRGNGAFERLGQVDRAGLFQYVGGDHVDRRQRRTFRAVAGARTGHHHRAQVLHPGLRLGRCLGRCVGRCRGRVRILRRRRVGECKQYRSSQRGRSDPTGTLVHEIPPKCFAATRPPQAKALAWLCPSADVPP